MSNEETGFGATRRTPRQGVGGSPVGSWVTIALAAVALVIGFLILRSINDNDSAALDPTPSTTPNSNTTLPQPEIPDVTSTTTIPVDPRIVDGASVIVANSNTVGGSAGDMTDELKAVGYTLVDPTNASGPTVDESIVYFDPEIAGAQDVANSVARDLGGLDVLTVETPAPTVDGDMGEAGVLVLLGDNQAGKTIAELSPQAGETVAAPDPAAEETPSTGDETANTDG